MLINWLLAAVPIALVLVLMISFRWSAAWAGIAGWMASLVVAGIGFGAGLEVLILAQAKSLLLSLSVLYILWAALFFFHVVNEAGGIAAIGKRLPALTADRGLQVLLLAWTLGTFLQAVSGFGVPTAVVAPLLVGLGIAPVTAVVVAGIGHAWAITFGSLGLAFQALVASSQEPAAFLAPSSAFMLGLVCFGCGLIVLGASGGKPWMVGNLVPLLVIGAGMSGVQYLFARAGLYTIATTAAGLTGIALGVGVARLQNRVRVPAPAESRGFTGDPAKHATAALAPVQADIENSAGLPITLALLPYLFLVTIVSVAQFVVPVTQALDSVVVRFNFPELRTSLGYVIPAEPGQPLSVLGHPGAQLCYAALLAFALFRSKHAYGENIGSLLLTRVFQSALPSSVGILSMVAMALTMQQTGMTWVLANGLSRAAGAAFPLVAPFIGSLGAFMTGSNINSNVLFAALQKDSAQLLGLSTPVILAAQTAGGAIGSAFAPAKVIVGCSTVGLAGQEGPVLKATLFYCLFLLLWVGLATLGWLWLS